MTKYFCPIHKVEMKENGLSIGGGGYDKDFNEVPKGKTIAWVRKWYKCPKDYCRAKVMVSDIKID